MNIRNEMHKVDQLIKKSLDSIGNERVIKLIQKKNILAGKKIRPYLYLVFRYLNAGKLVKKDIEIAAAIELIHYASLIHDDIIDKTIYRRGNITISSKEGNHQAVIIGDLLFSLALVLLSNTESCILNEVFVTMKKLSTGQALAYMHRYNYNLTEKEYFSIIRLKTASLFVLCMGIAAENKKPKDWKIFGEILGEYFQLKDDLNDITKTDINNSFEDLRTGEITLPIIYLKKRIKMEKFDYLIKNNRYMELRKVIIDEGISGDIKILINEKRRIVIDAINKMKISPAQKILLELVERL